MPEGKMRQRGTGPIHQQLEYADVGDWRLRLDWLVSRVYDSSAEFVLRHWLALTNSLVATFLALPILAPALMLLGMSAGASWIYSAYHSVCHQWAFRSFFLFGQQSVYSRDALQSLVGEAHVFDFIGNPALGFKVAFCERDVAIYSAILMAGLAFTRVRKHLVPPSLRLLGVLLLPIALDGTSQLLGLRESTWELRSLTGALFGVAAVWLIYPQVDRSVRRAALRAELR